MSTALAVQHGAFGRAALYRLNRPILPHAHREGHLVFLVDGAPGALSTDTEAIPLSHGSAAAVSPWEGHTFEPDPDCAPALFLVLYIDPVWFLAASRTARFALSFGRNRIEMTDPIRTWVGRVSSLLLADEPTDLFDGYLYELTQACFDQSWQWMPGASPLLVERQTFRDFRIRRALDLLRARFAEPVDLDGIAREAGLSRPHFFKLFKKQMGITPNIYVNTLKVEFAVDALTGSSRTVTDISHDLGFASQASFTRFFSSNVGIPPSDYRRVAQCAVP